MLATYLLTAKGWQFHEFIVESDRDFFIRMVEDMMKARLLGLPILGYDVHKLTNLAEG